MTDIFQKLMDFVNYTQIPAQIKDVDINGLLTNGWFMIPLIFLIGYQAVKKALKNLVLIGIAFGLWVFSGTHYVEEIRIDGIVQMDKVLPLAAVSLVTLCLLIYIFFIRSGD